MYTSTHEITFYKPSSEILPTVLRLMYDNKIVEYNRKCGYDYDFKFGPAWKCEEAEEAVKEIAKIFEKQSDTGYSRLVLMKIVPSGLTSLRAIFRMDIDQ